MKPPRLFIVVLMVPLVSMFGCSHFVGKHQQATTRPWVLSEKASLCVISEPMLLVNSDQELMKVDVADALGEALKPYFYRVQKIAVDEQAYDCHYRLHAHLLKAIDHSNRLDQWLQLAPKRSLSADDWALKVDIKQNVDGKLVDSTWVGYRSGFLRLREPKFQPHLQAILNGYAQRLSRTDKTF